MNDKLKPLLTGSRIRDILSRMSTVQTCGDTDKMTMLLRYIYLCHISREVAYDIYEDHDVRVDTRALFESVNVDCVLRVNRELASAYPVARLIQQSCALKHQGNQQLGRLKAEIHYQMRRMSECKAVAVMHMKSVEIESPEERKSYYHHVLKRLEDSELPSATRQERQELREVLDQNRQTVLAIRSNPVKLKPAKTFIENFCQYINQAPAA